MNRTISKHELGSTLVLRLETLAGLQVSPVMTVLWATIVVDIPTVSPPDDRIIDWTRGRGKEGIPVHPAVAMMITLVGKNFPHGDHLAGAIGNVAEA